MKFSAVFAISLIAFAPVASQAQAPYDYRERTRVLAFDPGSFFADQPKPWMSIVYSGDDYGYPVYSIAIRKGCTFDDKGDARRACGGRLIARQVRAPFSGTPPRPRNRGQKLFAALGSQKIADDSALRTALSQYGLEWQEADVGQCAPAMEMLGNSADLSFFVTPPLPKAGSGLPIVLHADKIRFEFRGGYLTESVYYGWIAPGSPGEWANRFAQSLEDCWRPAKAVRPWEIDPRT